MTEPVTCITILRQAALVRVKKLSYAGLARDLGITADRFVSFAEGRAELPFEVLQKMTADFFHGHACLDAETGMLKSTNTAAPRSYIHPDPYRPQPGFVLQAYSRGPQPVTPQKPQAKTKRAGWIKRNW